MELSILLPLVLIIFSLYFFIRNELVYNFRLKLLERVYDGYNWQNKANVYRKVSYHKMMLSFKPLRLKYFYSQEDIETLNS